jgi:hypothetical protein
LKVEGRRLKGGGGEEIREGDWVRGLGTGLRSGPRAIVDVLQPPLARLRAQEYGARHITVWPIDKLRKVKDDVS